MINFFPFYWWLQRRIVPGLRNSQYAYYEKLRPLLTQSTRWLDLGCGHQFFAPWMKIDEQEMVAGVGFVAGLEFDLCSLRQHPHMPNGVLGDVHKAPFRDGSFNLITANMVVEHLSEPAAALAEIRRLLAPGGLFLFHTTNYWHPLVFVAARIPQRLKNRIVEFLERRKEEDVYPAYYRINTAPEVRRLARANGFDVVEAALLSSSAETVSLGPLVVIELLMIRLFEKTRFARLRSNIVTVLQKSAGQ